MNIPGLTFTVEQLQAAVDAGRVTVRPHPELPFNVYNYAPDVQWAGDWDDVTLACRGLILDENYFIVARPWNKFFNLGQVNLPIQFDDPVEVMDKADGSLGILFPTGDWHSKWKGESQPDYAFATRGSFASDQAQHATAVWKKKYRSYIPNADLTMLFEIIYPSNRIVLDYEGRDDLILLGAVSNSTGYYVGPVEAASRLYNATTRLSWLDADNPLIEVMPYRTLSEALGAMGRKNAEGYVVRSNNFLVKIKEPDYLELHKLVTNITPRNIWRQLRDGQSVSQVVSVFPDEWHEFVAGIAQPLYDQFNYRMGKIIRGYSNALRALDAEHSRKQFALSIRNRPDKAYYFSLADHKPIHDQLWKELEPKGVDYGPGSE